MGKIIDFFKIIGAQSIGEVEVSQEETIENLDGLTKEQKSLLIEALNENERNAKKLEIEKIKNEETKGKFVSVKNRQETKYIPLQNNRKEDISKENREKDERAE